MRTLSPREKLLVAVLVVGGAVAFFMLRDGGLGFSSATGQGEKRDLPEGEPPVVRMDLMARAAAEFDSQGRNLFDYYTPPPPPAPPPPPPPPPVDRVERPLPPPRPKRNVDRGPVKPRPPTPNFKYLGFLGPKDSRIAVFENEEAGLMLAGIGDTVETEFRVVEFRYETVVMGYSDERFSGQTTEIEMKAN